MKEEIITIKITDDGTVEIDAHDSFGGHVAAGFTAELAAALGKVVERHEPGRHIHRYHHDHNGKDHVHIG